jgi:hypothetical protein
MHGGFEQSDTMTPSSSGANAVHITELNVIEEHTLFRITNQIKQSMMTYMTKRHSEQLNLSYIILASITTMSL